MKFFNQTQINELAQHIGQKLRTLFDSIVRMDNQDLHDVVDRWRSTPTMWIEADDITYGETAYVGVYFPLDATGTVTVGVNSEEITQDVSDGRAIFSFQNLPAGSYTINVTYSGDLKYAPTTGTTTMTVQ